MWCRTPLIPTRGRQKQEPGPARQQKPFLFWGHGGGGAVPVALRREQAGTLPLSYSLSYLEPANGYLTFFFFFKNYLFYVYEQTVAVLKHTIRGHQIPCGCWELDSGPLEEQFMLLTAEPPLYPPFSGL